VKPLDWIVLAIAAIVLCLAPFAARAADPEVEASVYSAHVASGDPITLQIRLRGDAAQSKPDIWPLERDFEVIDQHTSHRTSIVNGQIDESVDYTFALAPRRDGALVIPSLRVGDNATEPIPVTVSEHGSDVAERQAQPEPEPAAPAEPVLVETHVDRRDPYEQERVVLRIDLYVAGRAANWRSRRSASRAACACRDRARNAGSAVRSTTRCSKTSSRTVRARARFSRTSSARRRARSPRVRSP
jgi:hypothetical protein